MVFAPHPAARAAGRRGACAGYTLIELLLTAAIASALMLLALPAMTGMLDTQRRISAVTRFVSSLHFARGEAIKRNGRAVLCKSPDRESCTLSGNWEQGWIVFHDANNNARRDPGESLLQQQGPLGRRLLLAGNQPVAHYVSYSATGSAKMVSGAFQAGTFTLCPQSGTADDVRRIVLSGTGRPRTVKGEAADCP